MPEVAKNRYHVYKKYKGSEMMLVNENYGIVFSHMCTYISPHGVDIIVQCLTLHNFVQLCCCSCFKLYVDSRLS